MLVEISSEYLKARGVDNQEIWQPREINNTKKGNESLSCQEDKLFIANVIWQPPEISKKKRKTSQQC